jgi:hypothetical protein
LANQIVWCDIPVKDLDRSIRFYAAVTGQQIAKQDYPNFSIGMLPDNSGCLYIPGKDNATSETGLLVYFDCSGRLDEAVAQVQPHGGKVIQPRHQIGPHGFRALVLDSEGNRIALHSM